MGRLKDISPKPDGEKKILFIPDPSAVFDPSKPSWRNNVREALCDGDEIQNFLQAKDRITTFEIAHSRPNGRDRMMDIKGHWVDVYNQLKFEEQSATLALQNELRGK